MNEQETSKPISKKRKILFSVVTVLTLIALIVVIGEVAIRVFTPVGYKYPRYQFSSEYGMTLFSNTKVVNTRPGHWKFTYTINEYGYRGKPVHITNAYDKPNIVVIGDSFTYGTGVNDGEEYAAVMWDKVAEKYNVINLGCGGWGTTQEIRRFYEFGRLYDPEIVVMQFGNNDLRDNMKNKVTVIEDGKFKFVNSNSSINWVKKYLSYSIIQKSQIYNLFRNSVYHFFEKRVIAEEMQNFEKEAGISKQENFYNELLELFAEDMSKRGIKLYLISINDQLEGFPNIEEKVYELEGKGYLDYVDVRPWFENVTDYGSPEGHSWGVKAHAIVGNQLGAYILKDSAVPQMMVDSIHLSMNANN